MNRPSDRKEPDWSKVDLSRSTAQERLLYGKAIRGRRIALDMTQSQVAEASNVSARTVRNIEKGDVAAQPAVLSRILTALDIEVGGRRFGEDTEMWLAIIGPLIEALPAQDRTGVMGKVLQDLAAQLTPRVAQNRIRAGAVTAGRIPFELAEAAQGDSSDTDPSSE